ncbi:cerebellin 18 [Genypterus blacodes]|uniref:cerebellin 18 n=1 Tax=Genypterus blacodes TaxID=154954 RepID=UPI003F76FCE5
MVKSSVACLWGALCLFVSVEAMISSSIQILKEAALQWKGPMVCDGWDCDCTFNRQRSCCCAANDMFDLEQKTFEKMVDLWHKKLDLELTLAPLIDHTQVAFKAAMDPQVLQDRCFGPFNTDLSIPYSLVSLNHGSGYNSALSVFTAPRAGLYLFSATVYSHVTTFHHRLYHKVVMMKDGTAVASMWEDNREDSQDSSTQVVLLDMEKGSQVYMKLVAGRWLCNNFRDENNVFTGYLVYPY